MQESPFTRKLAQLENAWALLSGRSLASSQETDNETAVYAPLCGFILGVGCYVIAEFIQFFSRGIGSAFVAAIAIQAAWSFADRGRSLSALSWAGEVLGKWQERYYEESSLSRSYNILILNAVLITKIGALCFLIHKGLTPLLILAPLIMAASYTENASHAELTSITDKRILPIAAIVLAIITGLLSCQLVPAILALVAAVAAHIQLQRLSLKQLKVINMEISLAIAEICQCVALLILLIFAG